MVKKIIFREDVDEKALINFYKLIEQWSKKKGERPETWGDLKKILNGKKIPFSPEDLFEDHQKIEYFDIPKDAPHLAIPHIDDLKESKVKGEYPFPRYYDSGYVNPGKRKKISHDEFRRNRVAEYSCAKCS